MRRRVTSAILPVILAGLLAALLLLPAAASAYAPYRVPAHRPPVRSAHVRELLRGSRLTNSQGWIVASLSGGPYKVGFQNGFLTAQSTHYSILSLLGARGTAYRAISRRVARVVWAKVPREYRLELRGIADGLHAAGYRARQLLGRGRVQRLGGPGLLQAASARRRPRRRSPRRHAPRSSAKAPRAAAAPSSPPARRPPTACRSWVTTRGPATSTPSRTTSSTTSTPRTATPSASSPAAARSGAARTGTRTAPGSCSPRRPSPTRPTSPGAPGLRARPRGGAVRGHGAAVHRHPAHAATTAPTPTSGSWAIRPARSPRSSSAARSTTST